MTVRTIHQGSALAVVSSPAKGPELAQWFALEIAQRGSQAPIWTLATVATVGAQ